MNKRELERAVNEAHTTLMALQRAAAAATDCLSSASDDELRGWQMTVASLLDRVGDAENELTRLLAMTPTEGTQR